MGLWSCAAAIRPSLPGVDLLALLHSARNPCFLLHVSRALGIDFSINHQARPPFSVFNSIATEMQSKSKWKQMGELAMYNGRLDMAEDCLNHVMDLSELLPLYASLGEAEEAEGISKFVFLASCKKIR
ncbi:putative coatomer subunit beta'-3 isoform X2 [Arachis hypogaea]|uniref:putative coatomer subunit beta'-3 isoform X2 n=1 Tax=Arachis hypogaea TaxID=3818 RepID=UPI000DED0041|nr:putative coatomer subunit beta'-3 isoform X3 [Arachis hypogaea]